MRGTRGGGEEESADVRAIYLPSQSLFSSTLQEDITNFDFSLYNVRDADRMQQVLVSSDQVLWFHFFVGLNPGQRFLHYFVKVRVMG
jgi:hypothetical protein